MPAAAWATTYSVTSTADSGTGTLREALVMASSGDVISFNLPAASTIALASPLTISNNVTIQGPGASNLTISGANQFAVLVVESTVTNASISGLTIANGNPGDGYLGGGISNSGVLTVTDCAFTANVGTALANGGTLSVNDSTFSGNSTQTQGAAIINFSTLVVTDSTFSGNTAGGSGGAIFSESGSSATLTVSNSTFSDNSANAGGAITGEVVSGSHVLTVSNSVFVGNTARSTGFGAAIESYTDSGTSIANVSNSVFFNNLSDGVENDCNNCTSNTNETTGDPTLAPLGNYGGPMQTMLPLPGSAAICAGAAALLPTGLTTDQRNLPRTTSYTSNGTTTACVDAGAVQTNYQSVQFTNVPSGGYSGVQNQAVSPVPAVAITESGQNTGGVPLTLLFDGSSNGGSRLGPVTTVAGTGAVFTGLTGNIVGQGTLSISLPITTAANAVQPAALSASAMLNVAPQTISFGALPSLPFGSAPFAVSATSNSGLAVSFASQTPTVCRVSGATVTLVSGGTCILQATQAGNASYEAAVPVEQSFQITPIAQTLQFTAPASVAYTATPIALTGTASSSLAIAYSVSGPATVSGNLLTLTGLGSVVITASQAGNASYLAASPVTQTVVVNAAGTLANPTFTPAAGTYTAVQSVSLADATTGAAIYYTTDGSTPGVGTGTSTLYSGAAIPVETSETIHAIAVMAGYNESAASSAAYVINLPLPTPSLSASSLTVAQGSSATLTVSMAGTVGFNSPVTFGCSGLPAGATCSFNPATVTPSGTTPATTTLTVSVGTGTVAGVVRHGSHPWFPGFPASPGFPGSTLAVALGLLGVRRRRRWQALFVLALSVAGLSLITGCAGSAAGGNTSTVSVTATAAGVTSTAASFTLTVQ